MAPAHLHATRVAVYPALFFRLLILVGVSEDLTPLPIISWFILIEESLSVGLQVYPTVGP